MERSAEDWQDLLGGRFSLAKRISEETHEKLDSSATRIWTAIECFKKAGASADAPLLFESATEDHWVLFRSGNLTIASYRAEIGDYSTPFIISILTGQGAIA